MIENVEPETTLTFDGIADAEREMLLSAEEHYGQYFTHAMRMVALLNGVARSIDKPERFLFMAFLSHTKKHMTLALLSTLRRHHVQAGMNLRQALEGMAWAAYALAHEDVNLFRVDGPNGFEVPERLSMARNTWLTANYPDSSEEIRRLKKIINDSIAHANVSNAFSTLGFGTEERPGFTTSFFDPEDNYLIKTDLLHVANVAMGALGLFGLVNRTERVFQSPDGFGAQFQLAGEEHDQLRDEIRQHERFQATLVRQEARTQEAQEEEV